MQEWIAAGQPKGFEFFVSGKSAQWKMDFGEIDKEVGDVLMNRGLNIWIRSDS